MAKKQIDSDRWLFLVLMIACIPFVHSQSIEFYLLSSSPTRAIQIEPPLKGADEDADLKLGKRKVDLLEAKNAGESDGTVLFLKKRSELTDSLFYLENNSLYLSPNGFAWDFHFSSWQYGKNSSVANKRIAILHQEP